MKRMRMVAGALLVLGLTSGSAFAQTVTAVGVRAGANLATFTGEGADEDLDRRTGLALGGFLKLGLTDRILIQPEVLYMSKCASEGSGDDTIELSYLEVPVFLKVMIPTGAETGVRPFVMAGPQVSFKAGCTLADDDGDSFDCDDLGGPFEFKSTDFGAVVGAGVEVPAGPGALLLDLRYDIGLAGINDAEAANLEGDVKNAALSFLLGFSFPLGGAN